MRLVVQPLLTAGLVRFLASVQLPTGELPYRVGNAAAAARPHYLCFQYNAFEYLAIARYAENTGDPAALLTATAISETVFVAQASSEADWGWRPLDAPGDRYSSMNLAHSLVERLRVIHGGRSAVA